MNAIPLFLLPLAVLSAEERSAACDLEITIRPHRQDVIFGDPLYVEVTILNRAKEPVSNLPPCLDFNTFWFTVSGSNREVSYSTVHDMGGGLMGGLKPIVFEPGKPVKYYFCVFLPVYHRFEHPFWKRFRGGGNVVISGVYPLRSGVALSSSRVTLDARPESQIAALGYWNKKEANREDYKKGPTPANFHLPVNVANREEMGEFAVHTSLSGELGDLVDLSLRLRDLYELPPESREASNRELVEWLWKQPDVKREVLLREVHDLAASYNMRSTAEALQTLIKESDAEKSESSDAKRIDQLPEQSGRPPR